MARLKTDPNSELMVEADLERLAFCNVVNIGDRWLTHGQQGGWRAIPPGMGEFVERFFGPARLKKHRAEFAANRKALGDEAIRRLEERVTVPGAGYVHPGMLGE